MTARRHSGRRRRIRSAHNFYAPFYSQYIPATSRPAVERDWLALRRERAAERHRRVADTDGFNGFLDHRRSTATGSFAWTTQLQRRRRLEVPVLAGPAGPGRALPPASVRLQLRLGLHRRERRGQRQLRAGPRHVLRQPRAANKNLNGGCDLENVDPIGTAQIDVVGALSVPAVHGSDPAAAIRSTSRCTTCSRRPSPSSRRASTRTTSSRNSVARSSSRTRRTSTARRSPTSWSAGWPTANAAGFRVFAGDLPVPTADDPDADDHARSVARPAHHLPGSVGPRPPLHLHGSMGQLGNRGLQLEQDDGRRHRRVRQRGHPPRHDRDFATPPTLGQTRRPRAADGPPSSHVPTPTQLKQAVAVGATGPVLVATSTTVSQDHQVQAGQASRRSCTRSGSRRS